MSALSYKKNISLQITLFAKLVVAFSFLGCADRTVTIDESEGQVVYSVSGALDKEVTSPAFFKTFELFGIHYWELTMNSPSDSVRLDITISRDEPFGKPEAETYFIGSTRNQSEVFTAQLTRFNPDGTVLAVYSTQFTDLPFGELTFSVVEDEFVRGSFFFNGAYFNPLAKSFSEIAVRDGVFLAFEEE